MLLFCLFYVSFFVTKKKFLFLYLHQFTLNRARGRLAKGKRFIVEGKNNAIRLRLVSGSLVNTSSSHVTPAFKAILSLLADKRDGGAGIRTANSNRKMHCKSVW